MRADGEAAGEGRGLAPATTPSAPDAAAIAALDRAKTYARQAHAPETLRAYAHDWAHFSAWCRAAGLTPVPASPQTVAAYLAALAPQYSRSALERRLAAIGHRHKLLGHDWLPGHPAIRSTLRGIFRSHPTTHRRAAALTSAELKKMVAGCEENLAGIRDRALLLLGFAGALRRAELVAIDYEHLSVGSAGLRLRIPSSKTDVAGEGEELGIPRAKRKEHCPVRALEVWLERSDTRFGPVFRKVNRWGSIEPTRLGADAVRRILLRRATAAGLTVPSTERLSPHGLRAGFVTEAFAAGARDEAIMQHTRHRDLKTMRGYLRRARLVTDSPVHLLDL
jgi:integrase